MGADACIFAEQDKRYLYFDRKYNFTYEILPSDVLSLERVVIQCKTNLINADAIGHHARYWNEKILRFVKNHSTNTFRIISDYDGPDYHDVIRSDGYTEEDSEDV